MTLYCPKKIQRKFIPIKEQIQVSVELDHNQTYWTIAAWKRLWYAEGFLSRQEALDNIDQVCNTLYYRNNLDLLQTIINKGRAKLQPKNIKIYCKAPTETLKGAAIKQYAGKTWRDCLVKCFAFISKYDFVEIELQFIEFDADLSEYNSVLVDQDTMIEVIQTIQELHSSYELSSINYEIKNGGGHFAEYRTIRL